MCSIALTDLQINVDARQKLESQQQENKGVQKVSEGGSVYKKSLKLMGVHIGVCESSERCEHLQTYRSGPTQARSK